MGRDRGNGAGDPNLTVGQPVQVDGLVALQWNQEGRSGIAFRAGRHQHGFSASFWL